MVSLNETFGVPASDVTIISLNTQHLGTISLDQMVDLAEAIYEECDSEENIFSPGYDPEVADQRVAVLAARYGFTYDQVLAAIIERAYQEEEEATLTEYGYHRYANGWI